MSGERTGAGRKAEMVGRWRIAMNYICGIPHYIVYRLLDANGVDHAGNRTYATTYLKDLERARCVADRLNEEEEK